MFEQFFNNSSFSDVVVIINDEEFQLSSQILKQFSGFFKLELEKNIIEAPQEVVNNEKLNIMIIQKPIIKIINVTFDSVCVNHVLKYMYGKQFEITKENISMIHSISVALQIDELIIKCTSEPKKFVKRETLLEDYLSAYTSNTFILDTLEKHLVKNFRRYDKEKMFKLMIQLPINRVMSILKSTELKCHQDYIYEIVDAYVLSHDLTQDERIKLLGCIKFEKLSALILTTRLSQSNYICSDGYVRLLESIITSNNINEPDDDFYVGKQSAIYDGYRLVTNKECQMKSFVEKFRNFYIKKGGLSSLGEFNSGHLCCDTMPLHITVHLVSSTSYSKTKGDLIRFHDPHITSNESLYVRISLIYPQHVDIDKSRCIGLFVPVGIDFD